MRALASIARRIRTAAGTILSFGAIGDGQVLTRSGTEVIGTTVSSGAPTTASYWVQSASGDLSAEVVPETWGDIALEYSSGAVVLRPRARRRSLTWTYNGGSSSAWKGEGHADRTVGGTVNVVTAGAGCGGSGATAASANASAGWVQPTPDLSSSSDHDAEWYYGLGADITTCRHWIGMDTTTVSTTDSPTGDNYLLRYSTSASDTEWKLTTRDNSTTTVTSTGWDAPAASDVWHFQAKYRAGVSVSVRARYYRSGAWSSWSSWVSTTSTLPRTGQVLGPIAGVFTTAAAARTSVVFGYTSWEQLS